MATIRLYSGVVSPTYRFGNYGYPPIAPLFDTGSEADALSGGDGSDRFFAGYGDSVYGGADGSYGDYLFISFMGATSGVTADFRNSTQTIGGGTITNIENISWVQGSDFGDDITIGSSGGGYSNLTVVEGMGGNDRLIAHYYTGTLDGGDGDDYLDGELSQYLSQIYGGNGNDTIYERRTGSGAIYGDDGDDTIYSGMNTYGGAGNDTIVASFSQYGPTYFGDGGDDTLTGTATVDLLVGGTGGDILQGGDSNDILISENLTSTTYINGRLNGSSDDELTRDQLFGGNGNDAIAAGYGDDVDGGDGDDTLFLSLAGMAGMTFDTTGLASAQGLSFGGGTIRSVETLAEVRGSAGNDTFLIATQASQIGIDGGAGNDLVTAEGSSVAFSGGVGDDTLISGAVRDLFYGGEGNDTIDYRNATAGVTVSLSTYFAGRGPAGDELLGVETVKGSAFNDTLTGSDTADTLWGMNGDDTLAGGAGDDVLYGGAGSDTMTGGAGNDTFSIDSLGDTIVEAQGGGNDRVFVDFSYALAAGAEVETLSTTNAAGTAAIDFTGNEFANTLIGNAGVNILNGGAGADTLLGLAGDDVLIGDDGAANTLQGGIGNDTYYVSASGDSVVEAAGEGTDVVRTGLASYALGANVEYLVYTGTGGFVGTGNAGDNVIVGGAGDDILNGGLGADSLVGGGGADVLIGGDGAANTLQGGTGDDTYYVSVTGDSVIEFAGEGNDTVRTALANYALGGNIENLVYTGSAAFVGVGDGANNVITGGAGDDILNGQAGDDTLVGFAGNDILIGGTGANALQGGTGNDTYFITSASDSAIENAGEGYDKIRTDLASYTLPANVEALVYIGSGSFRGIGGAGDDLITGGSGADELYGYAGGDTLIGGGGADYLFGGDGADVLNGGAGNDRMTGGAGADRFQIADAGVDTITDFAAGSDRVLLSHLLFAGLSVGALSAGQFVRGTAAADADDRIIYNPATGAVLYDADGTGAQAAVQIAVISVPTGVLGAGDFAVI